MDSLNNNNVIPTDVKLTELEQKVFAQLMRLARKIGKPEDIKSEKLFQGVVKLCDAFNIVPSMVDLADGDVIANVMKSLIKKGFVKEFDPAGMMPSFIPKPYWQDKL